MNKMLLKAYGDQKIVYLFFPEDSGEPGEIEYDRVKKRAVIIRRAGHDWPNHEAHALSAVEKYAEKGYLPLESVNAWG